MRLLLLGGCGLALLVSGCGSSGTSQAAFRARADSICRQLGRQKGPAVNTKAALDEHVHRADARIDELARLRPPSGAEHAYRDLIATMRRAMSLVDTSFPALLGKKAPSPRAIRRIVGPVGRDVRRADADARALGLRACAQSFSGGSSSSSRSSNGPTPQQVESPAKRAFDRQMLAVSGRYRNAQRKAGAPLLETFQQRHPAPEKAWRAMLRKEVGLYDDEASAIARIDAPADARAEQQAIAAAYRVASKQAAEFAVSYRHHGHSNLPKYLSVDWPGQIRAAVRRLEAKGYALGSFDAIGFLTLSSSSKIVKSNQP